MARTKNRPGTAPSAAHAATGPAPAPVTDPAADSPAAAVHAALAANPAATVAVIADAAAIGKPAARDALLAMEKDGTATRVKGGKPGIPDTWTLAVPAQGDAGPAEDGREDERAAQPGDSTASSPDGPRDDETAVEAGHDGAAQTTGPGQPDGDAGASTEASAKDGTDAPDAATENPGPHDSAGDEDADGEQDDQAVPASGVPQADSDSDGPREDAAPGDSDGEPGDAPDPALVSEIIEHLGQIRAAADAAGLVLTARGDLKTALAGMDEIYEQAAEARRSLKAATSGRKAPAVRPGGLRDKVLAHLVANPGKEFTPHEIHKVLDHSSGAIANALDTLVNLGEAEVATEKPRRFRRAAQTAGAVSGTDGAGTVQDEGTELEGAA